MRAVPALPSFKVKIAYTLALDLDVHEPWHCNAVRRSRFAVIQMEAVLLVVLLSHLRNYHIFSEARGK